MAVRAEREKLEKELAALEVEIGGYLKELGYRSRRMDTLGDLVELSSGGTSVRFCR